MDEEKLSKLKFLEKRAREVTGSKDNFFGQHEIDQVK